MFCAVGACLLATGCTNPSANGADCETEETEIVRSCTEFCWANEEASCDPSWYREITSFEPASQAACAALCQSYYDYGQLTAVNEVGTVVCERETSHYLLCLSNVEACNYTDGCGVEYVGMRSCYRDWCADNPDDCVGEWPEL